MRTRSSDRPAARSLHSADADSGRPRAGRRALPFFSDDILQHRLIQRQLGHQTLELGVLVLELLQPSRLAGLQAAIDPLPAIKRVLRDPHPAAELGARNAEFVLLQYRKVCSTLNRFRFTASYPPSCRVSLPENPPELDFEEPRNCLKLRTVRKTPAGYYWLCHYYALSLLRVGKLYIRGVRKRSASL